MTVDEPRRREIASNHAARSVNEGYLVFFMIFHYHFCLVKPMTLKELLYVKTSSWSRVVLDLKAVEQIPRATGDVLNKAGYAAPNRIARDAPCSAQR
jgi:hypothetical protein